MTRRCLQLSGSDAEITEQLDRANLSPEDRAEVDTFRRYLRGDMSEMERHAYTVHDAPASDLAKVARTLEIAAGRGTMAEARECAGLSVGQAAKLLSMKVTNLRRVESGDMSPTPALWLMMVTAYDVADFTDAPRSKIIDGSSP